jgi:hypothetical protein
MGRKAAKDGERSVGNDALRTPCGILPAQKYVGRSNIFAMDDKPAAPEDPLDQPVVERALGAFQHSGFEIPADFDELPEADMRYWRGEGDEVDLRTNPPTDGSFEEPLID